MTQIYTRPILSLQEPPIFFTEAGNICPLSPQVSPKQVSERSIRSWSPSPNQPSMSAYRKVIFEVTSPKLGEKRRANHQEAGIHRQSLPPLSSIFSGAAQGGILGSSGRQSPPPGGLMVNPSEYRNPLVSYDQKRSRSSLDFQRRSPPHALLFDSSRRESAERPGLPPPLSTASSQTVELSRHDTRQSLSESQQYQKRIGTGDIWSPCHTRSNRSSYAGRVTPTPSGDQCEPTSPFNQQHIQEIGRSTYVNPPLNPHIPSGYPQTSSAYSDSTVVKDGLGPKIWTGTHFLPRFVRQAEVPGEGPCYFYDDGSYCKKVIDGEPVNAHWGVTKAGKPRKRLAIACITCREKKIKCDPDYPRCLQCEKFGRVCKFKNAPRGSNGSSDIPLADLKESLSRPGSSRDEESMPEKRENALPVSPSRIIRNKTPDTQLHHAKRQRLDFGEFPPIIENDSPQNQIRIAPSQATSFVDNLTLNTADKRPPQQCFINPYTVQPETVTELVSTFFKYVPEVANCMFLEGPFKKWALTIDEKSPEENVILNAVLCLASVFSSKQEQKALGKHYATTCRRIFENCPFSLQLVQSRLLLALYYFAKNDSELAWDLSGSAMRAAAALQLNLEIEKSNDTFRKVFPYGLNRTEYAECRRRTFWSTYLVDNLHEFCAGEFSKFKSEDIFLRLPCDENSFESQVEARIPLVNHAGIPYQGSNRSIGCMGYLVKIATLWGEVLANIYRRSQQAHTASLAAFTSFYDGATCRMREWNDTLPRRYTVSPENILRAANDGKLGTLITMHSVYHNTGMKLNRYIPHSALTSSQVAHHVAVANQHAEAFLTVIDALDAVRHSLQMQKYGDDSQQPKFSSPFVGYSIVSAVDILSAKLTRGTIAKRLTSFQSSQVLLSELCIFWQSLMNHQAAVEQRANELAELISDKDCKTSRSLVINFGDGNLKMRESIEPTPFRHDDCIYK
ncbi:hypothetical protein K3495_g5194 [Podosphaera aphanis]|nr:hypothetical protein K3495_g5194 [Podosphaera aphanis]